MRGEPVSRVGLIQASWLLPVMKKITLMTVAALAMAALGVHAQERPAIGDDAFRLRFAKDVDTAGLSIQYFLTGPFGGYGGSVRTRPKVWDYAIDTSYEGQPARHLKAIIYRPGYGVRLIDAPLPAVPAAVRVELEPLPSTRLSGRIVRPEGGAAKNFKLEIIYLALWGHEFFGITDGPVSAFRVAAAEVPGDGSFAITVPDFTRDPAVGALKGRGMFRLVAREPKTGNEAYTLERAGEAGRAAMLEIGAEYGEGLLLYAKARGER